MSVTIPIWPAIVLGVLALMVFAISRKIIVVTPVIVVILGLYGQHFLRQSALSALCVEHAGYQVEGKPESVEGVYFKTGEKFTWDDFQRISRLLPLPRRDPMALHVKFAEVDVATDRFAKPNRYRFEFISLDAAGGRRGCRSQPYSPWAKNEDYLRISETYMSVGSCLSINQVSTSPDIVPRRCVGNDHSVVCINYDVVPASGPLPSYETQSRKVAGGFWPARLEGLATQDVLSSADGSWQIAMGKVVVQGKFDSWLTSFAEELGIPRRYNRVCDGRLNYIMKMPNGLAD